MHALTRFLLIFLLSLCWSPSFLFIKLAIQTFSPFSAVACRLILAAFLMTGILVIKKRKFPWTWNFWKHSTILALFSTALPFTLFCYAEQTIESALAAIINGSTPMSTALLAHFTLKDDRLSPSKGVGILLSIFGLVWLFAPSLSFDWNGNLKGMLAAILASCCYSIGHVYAKKNVSGHPSFIAPAAQLWVGSLLMSLCALSFDTFTPPTPTSLLGVVGLGLIGTFTAFLLYYYLLDHCGPTAISTSACLFPVGGMLLGFLFLGETLTIGNIAAALFILLGALLVNQVIVWKEAQPLPSFTSNDLRHG